MVKAQESGKWLRLVTTIALIVSLWVITVTASSATLDQKICACVAKNGSLRVITATEICDKNETRLEWNISGVPGPIGPQGTEGPIGPQGPAGGVQRHVYNYIIDNASDGEYIAETIWSEVTEMGWPPRPCTKYVTVRYYNMVFPLPGSMSDLPIVNTSVGGYMVHVSQGFRTSADGSSLEMLFPFKWTRTETIVFADTGEIQGPGTSVYYDYNNGPDGLLDLQLIVLY